MGSLFYMKTLNFILSIQRVVMVEALSADLSVESLMQYYDVCDFAFNFNLIVHLAEPLTAQDVDQQVHDWLDNLPDGKTANWVVREMENHLMKK